MTTKKQPIKPDQPNPFGDMEDKSLEPLAEEAKTAAAPTGGATVSVKMLHHGSYDGEQLIPGHKYELPVQITRSLIANRRAVRV